MLTGTCTRPTQRRKFE